MIDTKRCTDRRSLTFENMREILADIEQFGDDPDAVRAAGNWTPAQIVRHVALGIDGSIDGINFRASWLLRAMGHLAKKSVLRKRMKPGFKLPPNMERAMPAADVSWPDAVASLRRAMARIDAGERMTFPSPAMGSMTHEQWEQFHCRHAEMHFSFIHPV